MSFRIVVVAGALLIGGSAIACAADEVIAAVYAELSLPIPTTTAIVICHGFGCQYRTEVALSNADRAKLASLLAPGAASPEAERRALAAATAWFDRRVGPAAGTTHRVALARSQSGDRGEMDCIDLSSNNTGLFLILDQLHLLHHHRVDHPSSRGIVYLGPTEHPEIARSAVEFGGLYYPAVIAVHAGWLAGPLGPWPPKMKAPAQGRALLSEA
jgi:hypothetical protein